MRSAWWWPHAPATKIAGSEIAQWRRRTTERAKKESVKTTADALRP
jgi:hypothetical protein